jgi:hypothetical protein
MFWHNYEIKIIFPAGVDKSLTLLHYFLGMGERHRRVFLKSFDTLSADDFLDRPLVFARPSDWHQALENEMRQATNRNFIQHNNAALPFVVTLPSPDTAEIAVPSGVPDSLRPRE